MNHVVISKEGLTIHCKPFDLLWHGRGGPTAAGVEQPQNAGCNPHSCGYSRPFQGRVAQAPPPVHPKFHFGKQISLFKTFPTKETKVTLTICAPGRDTPTTMSPHQGSQGRAAATAARPAPEQRRERRLHLAVPVKVFPDLKSLDSQTCVTYEISTIGARLVAPQGVKEIGQIIGLERHKRRARYKVVWIGKPGT